MKTSVIMQRPFNGKIIRQNSKTGFLNLNDLMDCHLVENPDSSKRIQKYMELDQTIEFADTIRIAQLEAANQNSPKTGEFVLPLAEPLSVIETKRGKYGGTWVHPYLFLDFAMWLSPRFKLWAMGIIEDKLIELRNEAGDKFKDMTSALKKAGATSPREYMREATLMNELVFDNATAEQRNSATIEQLALLNKLQKYNAHLIDQGKSYALRKAECINFVKFYNFIK
jgi:hypothetical protein